VTWSSRCGALLAAAAVVPLASILVGCGAGHGTHDVQLRPVASDLQRARTLVLTKTDLPHGFRLRRQHGSPLSKFPTACRKLAAPDLSELTETATVAGRVLANTHAGAEYLPAAAVFSSATQASHAQQLETGPVDVQCAVLIIKNDLKQLSAPSKVTGETRHVVARREDGVIVRGRQVILDVTVRPNYRFRAEVSFIFLRHGRALSEIRTQSAWNAATRRTWNDVIDAAARRLARSGL